jgi:glycosyltransferase involved in cell wall biosynthesis
MDMMSKLRVAMIAPFGIRPKGTLAARMLPLAIELQRRGHHVRIIAPSYLNPQDAATISQVSGVWVQHGRLPCLSGPLAAFEIAIDLLNAARRFQPDILHVFKPKGYSGLAALMSRLVRPALPLIQDTDDWEGWGGWNDLVPYSCSMKTVFAWQERTLPRLAAGVSVASRTLQTQVWGFGVPTDRVWYVPNGVPSHPPVLPTREQARQQLRLGPHPIVLLYTRFWEYPLQDIIAVLIALRERRPDARLLVIGAGEHGEEHQLVALAQRAGVAQWLDQRGWADQAMIRAAFAAADVALAPFADTLMNRAKGMAKLLELLHAGVPVIASRVGQATEYIVDGRSGVLVRPEDGALAQATLQLLNNPSQAQALGAAGSRYVSEHFGWNRLAKTLETAYGAVLARLSTLGA